MGRWEISVRETQLQELEENPVQQSDNCASKYQVVGRSKHGISVDGGSPVTGNPEARSSHIRKDCQEKTGKTSWLSVVKL